MRFIVVTAPSLQELADLLNGMSLGSGRIQGYTVNTTGAYETLVDMTPIHVVTNDDLLMEIDLIEEKGITLTA